MPTATVSLTITYTTEELATLKEMFANANGTVPTNAELVANVKAFLSKQLQQRYRGYAHDKATAAISVTGLSVS